MTGDLDSSVTQWLTALKGGDRDTALRQLWERYFERLSRLAHRHLGAAVGGPVDGEDVALSALDSLFRGATEGRFPQLDDRDDLWSLLATITLRKASNQRRHERQWKRGGGRVVVASALEDAGQGDVLAQVAADQPTPERAVTLVDELRRRLDDLPDESLRAVVLLRMDGHTTAEIARVLDCSPRSIDRKLQLIRTLWTREARR